MNLCKKNELLVFFFAVPRQHYVSELLFCFCAVAFFSSLFCFATLTFRFTLLSLVSRAVDSSL